MIVKCPQCGVAYYETTDTFNPNASPNGSMLRLRDPWKSMGWYTYGVDRGDGASMLASDLECTGCYAPLAPSGRLRVNTKQVKSRAQEGEVDKKYYDRISKQEAQRKKSREKLIPESVLIDIVNRCFQDCGLYTPGDEFIDQEAKEVMEDLL